LKNKRSSSASTQKSASRGYDFIRDNVFALSVVSIFILLITSNIAFAQWNNHYPKLTDFGHHTYLEQHELPIHTFGITDPAPSPDNKRIAIASKGWIWLFDIESGLAKRITSEAAVDSRPRWSPDGKQLAFVRDLGNDTAVVVKHLATGEELIVNSDAIELDPEFSADDRFLFYTSGKSGSLELYKRNIASTLEQKITSLRQVVRNTRRVAKDQGIVYLHGLGAQRVLRYRNFIAGTDEIVQAQTLTYHLSSDLHPTMPLLVYSAPIDNDYHLWTMDLSKTKVMNRLTDGARFALTPAFSADGQHIYFVELDAKRQFQLMQISTYGGKSRRVEVKDWDYGAPTGTLTISVFNQHNQPEAARLSIVSQQGHPVANPVGATFVDPQTGRTYFYVDQSVALNLPVGDYQILATRGSMTSVFSADVSVKESTPSALSIALSPIWDAAKAGYVSADFHVHLNGDGHQRANHNDALLQLRGEGLNYLAPMSWNRWERRIDSQIIGLQTSHIENGNEYQIVQGQEVRSHFHGHIGLLNVKDAFVPWFFGPNNPALGNINLSNADVFAFAIKVGAFATYVHPVGTDGDPFDAENINDIPLELISDGVLEPQMGLELVCAWTSPLGASNLWYRFLNIGQPVSAMSGTDGWIDFHRTPAVGTVRAYVRPLTNKAFDDPILAGAVAGRSFVTTSPSLLFSVADSKPGDTVKQGEQDFALTIASTVALETVEIIVNGKAVQLLEGVNAGESKTFNGTVKLPKGGWVAARAFASERQADSWPTMHARPFAHSSPIWINQMGSTDKTASASAAADLISAINAAEQQVRDAYGDRAMPKIYARFEAARTKLRTMQ
jgi:TolB protein